MIEGLKQLHLIGQCLSDQNLISTNNISSPYRENFVSSRAIAFLFSVKAKVQVPVPQPLDGNRRPQRPTLQPLLYGNKAAYHVPHLLRYHHES